MAVTTTPDLNFDPYDVEITANPYPVLRRLREEAPLYYNERYDFYALSRYDDIERALKDKDTFINGKGNVLELIKADVEQPPGTLIFEDPPAHTLHRKLLSRAFTPKRVNALEQQIRDFTIECLDPLVGSDGFDVEPRVEADRHLRRLHRLASRAPVRRRHVRPPVGDLRGRARRRAHPHPERGAALRQHRRRRGQRDDEPA